MPKLIDKAKRDKRLGLAFTQDEFDNLATFARLNGQSPSVTAWQIVVDFLHDRAGVIDKAKQADEAYRQSLDKIRAQSSD